jgi:sensor histidine kinase YesM
VLSKLKKRIAVSLRARVLFYIALTLALAMLISTAIASIYFYRVSRRQVLSDERAKLSQIARHLEYQSEDLIYFANSIAVDSELQELLSQKSFATAFDKARNYRDISELLQFYNSMRSYIVVSTVFSSDGDGFSSRGSQNEMLFSEEYANERLLSYIQDEDMIFSEIYTAKVSNSTVDIICYKTVIRNIDRPSEVIGYLYMEAKADHFVEPLLSFDKEDKAYFWTDKSGNMIFSNSELPPNSTLGEYNVDATTKTSNGYFISESLPGAGWVLNVYISDQFILSKSQFVIIFFALFFIITLMIMLLIIHPVLGKVTRPIVRLTDIMGTVRKGNFSLHEYHDSEDEIAMLYSGFNEMIAETERFLSEQKKYEENKKELQFAILMSQINPHYLYNVLNTIAFLAQAEGNTNVVKLVQAQIAVLQDGLKIGEKSIYSTIENELEVLENYLLIQQYRYPEKFSVNIQVEEGLSAVIIPKTIIQPLVENAIFHGVASKSGKGTIQISISRDNEMIVISVEDDGIGFEEEVLEQFHTGAELYFDGSDRPRIGLVNIRDRLNFSYPGTAEFTIESEKNQYSRVRIAFPIK